jgi:hypothetical protein
VPLNLLIMVGFSVCDTRLMSLSRSVLSPVFGLGRYDYGIMLYRYPMEFAKHVLLFWIAVGAIYVVDSYREAHNRQLATAISAGAKIDRITPRERREAAG